MMLLILEDKMEKSSRIKKSFFNVSSNFIINIVKVILSFVTRTFFIHYLGKEALGLNRIIYQYIINAVFNRFRD